MEANRDLARDDPSSTLESWSLANDEVEIVAPGGIYGRIAPNGRWLAFISLHPLELSADATITGVDRGLTEPHVYVLELASQRVVYHAAHESVNTLLLEHFGADVWKFLA
jgi:hypothetical protein